MTVATTASSISYAEDGTSVVFAVPFKFGLATDLVVRRLIPGAAAVLLALGTDYSVSGAGADAGGSITRTAATSGATLLIDRKTSRIQDMHYATGDRFPAASHEAALDRLSEVDQEQDTQLSRALQVPPGETGGTLPALADRQGKVVTFGADGGLAAVDSFGLGIAEYFGGGDWAEDAPLLDQGDWNMATVGNWGPFRFKGPTAARALFENVTLAMGEEVFANDIDTKFVGDGRTPGGVPMRNGWGLRPESFRQPGDVNDGQSFQRMVAWAEANHIINIYLSDRFYDISGYQLVISTALQFGGAGFTESGILPADDGGAFATPVLGTYIKCNCVGAPGILVQGGNARGARFDAIGFYQDQPTPADGWAPNDYDYILRAQDCQGGIELGRIQLLGVTRFFDCVNSGRPVIEEIRGQWFVNCIRLDLDEDATEVKHVHGHLFWANHSAVRAYMQTHNETLIAARSDGLKIGYLFAFCGLALMRFTDLGNGPTSGFHVDFAYADAHKEHTVFDAPAISGYIGSWIHSAADSNAGMTATAQAGSHSFRSTAAAVNGRLDVGRIDSQRLDGTGAPGQWIRNEGGTTIRVFAPYFVNAGAARPIYSPLAPVQLVNAPVTDYSGPLTTTPTEVVFGLSTSNGGLLPTFANNAAALAGGLLAGWIYVDPNDFVKRVHT